ncbi:MAG: hypothetical protein OZ922_14485 [Myxococcales bacterium]|nr:hypothetical protein [Myxococcales bacterium]
MAEFTEAKRVYTAAKGHEVCGFALGGLAHAGLSQLRARNSKMDQLARALRPLRPLVDCELETTVRSQSKKPPPNEGTVAGVIRIQRIQPFGRAAGAKEDDSLPVGRPLLDEVEEIGDRSGLGEARRTAVDHAWVPEPRQLPVPSAGGTLERAATKARGSGVVLQADVDKERRRETALALELCCHTKQVLNRLSPAGVAPRECGQHGTAKLRNDEGGINYLSRCWRLPEDYGIFLLLAGFARTSLEPRPVHA